MSDSSRPSDALRVKRLHITLAAAVLALAACGGGGDDGDPPAGGPGSTRPAASIDTLEGDWAQKGCVKVGSQSFKKMLRTRAVDAATLDYHEGVLTFGNNDCTGTPWLDGPTKVGTVTFARSEAGQALSAYWGELHTVTGLRFGAIWTAQSARLLCLLGDEIPSTQRTLSAVAASVATLPAESCFTH